jgi:hypothetical protein
MTGREVDKGVRGLSEERCGVPDSVADQYNNTWERKLSVQSGRKEAERQQKSEELIN